MLRAPRVRDEEWKEEKEEQEEIDPRTPNSVRTIRIRGGSSETATKETIPPIAAMVVSLETAIGTKGPSVGQINPYKANPAKRDRVNVAGTGRAVIKPPLLDLKIPRRAPAGDIIIVGASADHPNNSRTTGLSTTGARIRTNRSEVRPSNPDRVAVTKDRATTTAIRHRTTETSTGKTERHSTTHVVSDHRTTARDQASNAETTRTETRDADSDSSSARTGQRPQPTSSH